MEIDKKFMEMDVGSTAFATMEEFLEYERKWQLERKAILRAMGQVPDDEVDPDADAEMDADDLDEYDDL